MLGAGVLGAGVLGAGVESASAVAGRSLGRSGWSAAVLLGGVPCHHRWPSRSDADPSTPAAHVFLVARQNHRGLKAAQLAARDWAAGSHPTITLRGLVVIADAPGKLPKALHNLTRITAGGVPQTWVLPWIEELRLQGTVDPESLARELRKVLTSLSEVIDRLNSGRN
ncbi:DUF6668 family protein [Arthrobacter sp. TMS2-4]